MPPQASSSSSSSSNVDISQHVGFTNIGNSCFANSVLQACSASRPLRALYHAEGDLALPEAAANRAMATASMGSRRINRRKIPALFLADEEEKMPIAPPLTDEQADQLAALLKLSNAFRHFLDKTWRTSTAPSKQPNQVPKHLLKLLNNKYDSFSGRDQQDAHEMLRVLLDAMRMEEMDFIKKFRPPLQHKKRNGQSLAGSTTGSTASLSALSAADDDSSNGQGASSYPEASSQSKGEGPDPIWDDMTTLVDVLWGGQLASMVVCEGCRHVSHTYEDFLDLSLPLRPEDSMSAKERATRFKSISDRWRRPRGSSAAGASGRSGSVSEARESILRGTVAKDGMDVAPVIATTESNDSEKRNKRLSRRVEPASADEGEVGPSSAGWSGWAAGLSRSISMRPSSVAPKKGLQTQDDVSLKEVTNLPDVGSLALQPRPATTQPEPEAATLSPQSSTDGIAAAFEQKSRGSRDLLRALSTASRAPSRAQSRTGDHRSNSKSRDSEPKISEAASGHRHHHPHLLGGLHLHHQPAKKEPSKQAKYILRVFGEASETGVSEDSDPVRAKIRAAQANTGLVTAIRTFATAEVLSDENAFNCKRCWRRLNPAKGQERELMRRRRIRKGKPASGSEDSEDDEPHGDEEDDSLTSDASTQPSPAMPPTLVAPQAKRASASVAPLAFDSDVSDGEDVPNALMNGTLRIDPSAGGALSAVEILEAGVRTPVSRPASAQPLANTSASIPDAETPPEPSRTHTDETLSAEGTKEAKSVEDSGIEKSSAGLSAPQHPSEGSVTPIAAAASSRPSNQPSDGSAPEPSADTPVGKAVAMNGNCMTLDEAKTSSRRVSITSATSADSSTQNRTLGASRSVSSAANRTAPPASVPRSLKTKRSSHSIPRRALKRYLISSFPPLLVFHLKRFQATGKNNGFFASSSSGSFKKIDDVVTYPELLDMSEWRAPAREEYDRHGSLKTTSDSSVLEAHRRELAETGEDVSGDNLLAAQASRSSRWVNMLSRGSDAVSSREGAASPFSGLSRGPSPAPQSTLSQTAPQITPSASVGSSTRAPAPALSPAPLYRLYAVVAHHGSTMQSGHYTAYVLSDRCNMKAASSASTGAAPAEKSKKRRSSGGAKGSDSVLVASPTSEVPQESAPGVGASTSTLTSLSSQEASITGSERSATGSSSSSSAATTPPSSAATTNGTITPMALADSMTPIDLVMANLSSTQAEGKAKVDPLSPPSKASSAAASDVSTNGVAAPSKRASNSGSGSSVSALPNEAQRQWVYCSDTTIRAATLDQVLKCKDAYMVWYERVE